MIRRSLAVFAALSVVILATAPAAGAQESRPSSEFEDESERYSDAQLDNLVGSVALYPDALLAQVLVAATFPDQIEEAARFVRANGTDGVDDENWDVSVKAVAHYPSALNMMADKLDWTSALGRAYAVQSSDVMQAVQRMRAMADGQGNLRNSEQQTVVRDESNYVIAPTQTRVLYVPVYDPYAVYRRPIFLNGFRSSFWSFGVGFPIGSWLTYDVNWRNRAVYYNGWDASYYGYAGGWRQRSRPFINITNIYVNPRYRNVYINRDVVRRRVVYGNIDRYPGVHRDTRFSRGPVIVGGGPRGVGYDRGYDRRYDRRDDRDDRDDRYDRYDRNDRASSRGIDRSRGVIVNQNDRSVDRSRTVDRSRSVDRSRTVIVNQGEGGSIGRRYDGRGDDRRASGPVERRGDMRRDNPSEMMRGPQRNDAPMINPRRAERAPSTPPAGGRENNGGGNGGRRGNREARERP
jgi:hypothetical protein